MAEKPFREKTIAKKIKAAAADTGDKDEFQDIVNRGAGLLKGDFYDKQIEVKHKIEKNEGEEKYAKDYSDILKYQRDIQKPFYKEFEKLHGEVISSASDDPVAARLAALEKTVGQLAHFISTNLRPDLSKSALKGAATPARKKSSRSE
jgi:hypothetical protein